MEDASRVGVMEADHRLRESHDSLVSELMRRALEQNPELAEQLRKVEAQQERVREMRQSEEISQYRAWKKRLDDARVASRKRAYDDRRNVNKLNAIRRDPYHRSLPRLEQIEREIERYWRPYGLDVPKELIDELSELRSKSA